MSEDTDILTRISRLAGQINRFRDDQGPSDKGHHAQPSAIGYSRPHSTSAKTKVLRSFNQGRIAKSSSRGPRRHRNKSLVVKRPGAEGAFNDGETSLIDARKSGILDVSQAELPDNKGWVSKRSRHLQLISPSVFEKEISSRQAGAKSSTHSNSSEAPAAFGNLSSSCVHENLQTNGIPGSSCKALKQCGRFTQTGRCALGLNCRFSHDPAKVAVCRNFLKVGQCSMGQHCDLSHELSYERVPACIHFVKGNCAKPDCRYPHVRTNPAALVCRDFSMLGYCDRGVGCPQRHVFECPDFSSSGSCPSKKCQLLHVYRAGHLRHHASATPASITPVDQKVSTDSMESSSSEANILDVASLGNDARNKQIGPDREKFLEEQDFVSL